MLMAVMKEPKTHVLKASVDVFDFMLLRTKSFEVRRDDRDYSVGDTLMLREWNPRLEKYTGRSCRCLVTYLLPGGRFGIQEGFVCMSVKRLP